MSSSCLRRVAVPVKRVWRGLSGRRHRWTTGKLSTYVPVNPEVDDRSDDDVGVGGGLAGLGRLRKEVRTCEYRDVHVMWEMLSSSSNGNGGGGSRRDDVADVAAAVAGKGAPPGTTRLTRRRGRKPAPWSRLVAYCGGAF